MAHEIIADGNLSDWPVGHFFVSDPDDISGANNFVDIRELHVTIQNDRLYVGYVNDQPVIYNWAYILYLDTDNSAATGFQVGGIGADYILEENELKMYVGTGDDWEWATREVITVSINDNTVELWTPRSFLKGVTTIRMYFVGDNLAYEPKGKGEDSVPDSDPDDQWISYDVVHNRGDVRGQ